MKLTPTASTSIRSCPGPAVGSAASSSLRTSGPPLSWMRMDFISARRVGRQAAIRLLEHRLRNGLQLHVARAFVDRTDLRVAIELLGRVVLRVAVATEQLQRDRRHPLGDLRREELRHRALERDVLAGV